MLQSLRGRRPLGVILAVLCTFSCSDPETEKVRHVARGDEYVADKRDAFAVVEYASAIKIDPRYGEAHYKLAEAYERMNNLPAAFPEYIRAADALPNDRTAQIKAIRVLMLSGRFEDAKARAAALLARDPKDVEVLLLHAHTLVALRDPNGALAQIDEALAVNPDSSQAFVTLGAVRMRSGEATEAEAAFRRAVALEPSSVDAKLALANFLWAGGRVAEAEASIKEALAHTPRHLLANRMLGTLYIATRRIGDAEQPLKTVAELSTVPGPRLQLADYYVSVGRAADAIAVLTPLAADRATFAEAEVRLAALDYTQGRVPEAHTRLDEVIAKARSPQALVMKTQWLTKENKLDEALEQGRAAVAANPQSAPAHFALAAVYDRRRETGEAVKSYTEVLRLNPRAAAAEVELSRLSLTVGDRAGALQHAEQARQVAPANLNARVVLARSLIASGNLARAEAEIKALLGYAPNAAVVHAIDGALQAGKRNVAGARRSYERALELSPGFLEAIAGLTYLDIGTKAPAQAVSRLEAEIARQPSNASVFALLAQAHAAAGDHRKEEEALRRAVSVDPRFTNGYAMLAQLYLRQRRIDEARAEFEAIVQRDPSAVAARTVVGVLFEVQGRRDEATKSYEATVKSTDNAPVAANNLAFIYAEAGTNLDAALQLATLAKQRLPDDPRVDDTLGWIYYKRDLPAVGVKYLEDSLAKRPNAPGVLYHLGVTYVKLGDKAKARDTLGRAVQIDPSAGGGEARRVLETLAGRP